MKPEFQRELANIARVSRMLEVVLGFAAVLVAVALFYFSWLVFSTPTGTGDSVTVTLGQFRYGLADLRSGALNGTDKTVLLLVMCVVAFFVEAFLLLAIQLMKCFKAQQLFSDKSIYHARVLAWTYLAYLVCSGVYSLVLPLFVPVPATILALDLHGFFVLGLLWIFVWMLQVGRALHLDSELSI